MKILALILFLATQSVSAKVLTVSSNSKILFNVDYMKVSSVDGLFKSFQGTATMDEKETTLSNVKVSIKAASVDTDDPKRDFHVRDHEFFFVSKYPVIEFKASAPVAIGKDKKFELKGELSLRGVKKPLVLRGVYKGKMTGPDKKDIYFFDFSGEINRQDYGMNWNKALDNGGYLVGDDIRLKINAQAE